MIARGTRALAATALLAFLLAPTAFVFPLALSGGTVLRFPPDGFGLEHVTAIVTEPMWRDAFVTSFQVGALAALLATVVGTLAAIAVPGARRLIAGPLETVIIVPFVVPPIVLAVGWFAVFSRLRLVGTLPSVVIGHAILGLPFVYLNVLNGLAGIDRDLVRAARSLGAGPLVVFARIVVPLLGPSIAAGAILTFILSFDELIVSLFVGGGLVGTLPVVMWAQITYVATPEIAAAAAVSVVLSLTGLAVAVASWRLTRARRLSPWR